MKNLIYFILAITLLSVSCSKKDDGNVTPPVTKTPGQLHPEYLGKWHCDSVYIDGISSINGTLGIYGDNYNFTKDSLFQTNDNNLGINYGLSWGISGDTITISTTENNETNTYTMTIISPPANNKMVLLDRGLTQIMSKR